MPQGKRIIRGVGQGGNFARNVALPFLFRKQRRDDIHEQDLYDRHARKDHRVAYVRPLGWRDLVRIGEDRRVKAWSPFIILMVVVVIWTLPAFRSLFDADGPLSGTTLSFKIPGLHDLVIRTEPIVDKATPYAATYKLDVIAATGSGILLAAVLSMFVLGISPREGIGVFKDTVKDLVKSIVTIAFVLGFAFIANYSGVSSTLALAIASSGHWFPFFSPVLGWLGVFLTGSEWSNALFSSLQRITAHQIGVSDVLMVAANSTGGVTGKMISPQSIAVACAAVGLVGRESELLRFTAKWSIVFLLIICVITYGFRRTTSSG
jgi:lactate permease